MKHLLNFATICLVAVFVISCTGSGNRENRTPADAAVSVASEVTNNNIVGYTWRLVVLHGEDVKVEDETRRPYFILSAEDDRMSGNGGCNNIGGTFVIEDENRIRFSEMFATRMFCADGMDLEDELLRIFDITDNFVISPCCGKLSFNEGETRLARFEKADELS